MAEPMNPFLVGDTFDTETVGRSITSPDIIEPDETQENVLPDLERVSLDHIAGKLLRDNLTLTALELHTELVESGRELPRLRDYFSNPTNFERTKQTELSPTGLVRTSSVQTFDSLDFARYSDDGERNESDRVAVLEFELRKAQETIKSLRATLTKAAENELSTPETPEHREEDLNGDEPIRTYEKRALNFLVNEYLLNNMNKLTSVTFAEENENQDFEDWDDVGLNMAKPPDLLRLYRDYGQHTMPSAATRDVACMAEVERDQEEELRKELANQELVARVAQLEDKIFRLTSENEFLAHHVKAMESDWLEMKPVSEDAETVRALRNKSSTPAVSPINTPLKHAAVRPTELKYRYKAQEQNTQQVTKQTQREEQQEQNDSERGVAALENTSSDSVDAVQSDSQEPNGDVTSDAVSHTDSTSAAEPKHRTTEHRPVTIPAENEPPGGEALYNHIPTAASHNDTSMDVHMGTELRSPTSTLSGSYSEEVPSPTGDYPVTDIPSNNRRFTNSSSEKNVKNRCRSAAFQKALRNTAFQVAHDNRILSEVSRLSESSRDKVVLMLGRCLPHIVPNVLLAKREELIPLILCTATLHPDPDVRDELLNILFNLIKRPDNEQRHMILTGCMAFSQYVGPDRVEAELLPQCWEQISHKYAERRLLVAEACGCLAPYLPNEMRSSLVLSMLKQMMQDDKADEVRESVVRSLGLLMGYIDDPDKYTEGAHLLYEALKDPADRVQASVTNVFLPAFAMWALELGYLESHLIQSLVDKISALVKGGESIHKPKSRGVVPPDKQQFCLLVQTLTQVVPMLFSSVIMNGPFKDQPGPSDEYIQQFSVASRFPDAPCDLCNLSVIHGSVLELAGVVHRYEAYIGAEWYDPWEEYNWVAGDLVPQLLSLLNVLDVSSSDVVHQMTALFSHLCKTFGRTFTLTKIKNKFQVVLNLPEEGADDVMAVAQTPLTKCTVPVYTAGILGTLGQEEDRQLLSTFLKDLLRTLSLSQVSLASLQAAFTELCLNSDHHDLLLAVLWDGVVHTSALVRSTAAKMFELLIKGVNEVLVSSRVIPALVTLASDPEISVRIATIPAFGTVMESVTDRMMLDKVHMQFQSFMDDPMYRDQHAVQIEIVSTFGRVGPNTEPHFRDDFVLPRLTVMAAANSQTSNGSRKREMALQLFDAYSALSCCFISDQLLQEVMLPGLHYIHSDTQQVAPEMVDVIGSMIREVQDKVESGKLADKSHGVPGTAPILPPGDDMKSKMFSRFKDVTQTKANFSKIFGKK